MYGNIMNKGVLTFDYIEIEKCKFHYSKYATDINNVDFDKVLVSSNSNGIQTPHNHLVRKRTLNHLAKLDKSLSVRLRTKWLWVRSSLLSLKLQIWRLFLARSSLTFRQL